jgi:hypothetical protein
MGEEGDGREHRRQRQDQRQVMVQVLQRRHTPRKLVEHPHHGREERQRGPE